jgi:plastocyanin
MLRKKVNRGYTLRIVIGTIMLAFMLLSGSAGAQGKTWYVLAGGETPNMAIQGMEFYPGNITINEGDTINWTLGGHNLHTVSFLSGGLAPIPGSNDSLSPAGGSTYNGTGMVSSGLIFPGMSYSLTFTKAGNYSYQCLIHSGMAGAVIVQNAGSPYPFTQGQYNEKGKKELKADLEMGKKLVENLRLTSIPGPNGTTVWQASIDIPLPVDAKHKASYMRFTPRTLKIHTNDQVVWTQLDPMEIHTVTFMAPGQKAPDFVIPIAGGFMINPDAAAPKGESSYNGTGNASSGILLPGQNYTLKFTKPGTYKYQCLIHDEMKMLGKVVVMPKHTEKHDEEDDQSKKHK